MSSLVKPHGGGDLKPLLLEGDALASEQERAASLPKVNVSSREALTTVSLSGRIFAAITARECCVNRALARAFPVSYSVHTSSPDAATHFEPSPEKSTW